MIRLAESITQTKKRNTLAVRTSRTVTVRTYMKININMKKTIGLMAIVFVSFLGVQSAHALITNKLTLGSTGSEVTQLQTYLTASPNLYPAGLITGHFGSLTLPSVYLGAR